MKLKKFTLFGLLALASVTITSCYLDLGIIQIGVKPNGGNIDIPPVDSKDVAQYYSTLDTSSNGQTFLSTLRTFNLSKRAKKVGYAAMGTSASGQFRFTDYDPNSVKYTTSGIPYGTKILSFYTGQVLSGTFTREHVWPASRLPGGRDNNIVDDDIYMPRPETNSNNGSRGNSVYAVSGGWDPVAEFGVNNCYGGTSIRGECARIIFYCMLTDDRLVLNNNTNNSGNNMGKIDDLVQWAMDNPVNDREKRRNVGGEYLQKNRNPFVDHPEYVCKIWGDTNSVTKSACQKAGY